MAGPWPQLGRWRSKDRPGDALRTVHGASHDDVDVVASLVAARRVPPLRPGRGSPHHLLLLHVRHRPAAGAARHRAVGEAVAVGASACREPVEHGHHRVAVRSPLLRDLRGHERQVCDRAELPGPGHRRGRRCCEPRHDHLQHAAAPCLCLAADD